MLLLAMGVALAMLVSFSAQTATAALPCTITWDGEAGTTSWATGVNWDTDVVPGPNDDVCIPDFSFGIDVVHSSGATTIASIQGSGGLEISGGALDVTGISDPISILVMSGGSLGGPGSVRIDGIGVW